MTKLLRFLMIFLNDLSQAYPSNKPLGNWTRDLVLRVEQFAKWATTAHQPVIFWMSGFTFPTGFLTAVLQTCARQNNVSVDSLSWEFVVSTVDDSNITQQPKVGERHCKIPPVSDLPETLQNISYRLGGSKHD